jgi:D-sorbitol dehydrogenase (acceptor)
MLVDARAADAVAQPLIECYPERVHALSANITRRQDIEAVIAASAERS